MSRSSAISVGQRLGAFAAGLTFEAIGPDVLEKLRCNILHDFGCAVAAHSAGEEIWATLRDRAPAEATILCDGSSVAAEHAAFANAALMHTRAQDDTHFAAKTHVGSAVVPAVLALAEREHRSGADLCVAVVAGCEVAAAVGERLAAATTARGFRATPVFGTLGAAAAAASILGLDERQTTNAIAIAASFSAGLNQTWLDGTSEYRLQLGMAARNGITAATLAAGGLRGARHWYEGEAGFARSFAGLDDVAGGDWELGERWRLLDVTYKPYPVCAITQSSVQVAIDLVNDNDLDSERIASVCCELNSADRTYPGTVNAGPFDDIGATLMSAQFCVAMALKNRTATLTGLREFDDPELMRLVGVTEVAGDDAIPNLGARLRLTTSDGQAFSGELLPDASTYGWDWDGVISNLERMAPEMAIGADQIDRLVSIVSGLADLADVSSLARVTVA